MTTTSLGERARAGVAGALLFIPLALGSTACGGNGSITSFNCSIDCPDGSHHQVNVSADGGDPCVAALASVCNSTTGTCSCNGSN